jgi:hypothetical protein
MKDHVHTGFVAFVFAGVSAVLFMHGVRFIAAKLAERDSTATMGATLGALVAFPESR